MSTEVYRGINPPLNNLDDLDDELLLSCKKVECFMCEKCKLKTLREQVRKLNRKIRF